MNKNKKKFIISIEKFVCGAQDMTQLAQDLGLI